MTLLTPTEVQARGVGLDLSLADLQSVIDLEEAELIRLFGPNYDGTATSETIAGGERNLYLKRAIESVSSVTERYSLSDTATTTLTTLDYYVWPGQGRIERLGGWWGAAVTVSYIPQDDTALRTMVLLELIRIATEQTTPTSGGVSGLSYSVRSGGDQTGNGWASQRSAQYRRLGWLTR